MTQEGGERHQNWSELEWHIWRLEFGFGGSQHSTILGVACHWQYTCVFYCSNVPRYLSEQVPMNSCYQFGLECFSVIILRITKLEVR